MQPELGLIEGFYGPLWSDGARLSVMRSLAARGYGFYLYAPKGDAFLRERWREPFPADRRETLTRFGRECAKVGVRFGMGISPMEVFRAFDGPAKSALADVLSLCVDAGAQDLAVLFDDMSAAGVTDLALRQAEVVAWAADRVPGLRVFMCPTYYSDDVLLDKQFGPRPESYLEELGTHLASGTEVFWTGPEVCSRELSLAHLRAVADRLGRKPFLWDNYPVNDGARMSNHLHLRGFTGRHWAAADVIAGHGVNPALQPVLSLVPLLTLSLMYEQQESYDYAQAFEQAAQDVLGHDMASALKDDLIALQDVGRDRLTVMRVQAIKHRYGQWAREQPAAQEILEWIEIAKAWA